MLVLFDLFRGFIRSKKKTLQQIRLPNLYDWSADDLRTAPPPLLYDWYGDDNVRMLKQCPTEPSDDASERENHNLTLIKCSQTFSAMNARTVNRHSLVRRVVACRRRTISICRSRDANTRPTVDAP